MKAHFRQARSNCLVYFLFLPPAALAQSPSPQVTVHLDPQNAEIHWTLKDVLHTVRGTFQLKGGAMTYDPSTGAAQGQILVDVTTGQSGNQTRDGKMQQEVLESRKYPEAFFHPVKLSGTLKPDATQNVTVDGTFTIHGQDHQLTLQLQVQLNRQEATAVTHFVIPYVAWGMKDESTMFLRVEKRVDVDVTVHGTVEGLSQIQAK